MTAAAIHQNVRMGAIDDRSSDYRRQARRLRHTLRREPAKLHRSLRYLSACHDLFTGKHSSRSTQPAQMSSPGYVIDQTSHLIRDFASTVVQSMNGPILTGSNRIKLMHKAEQIGLRSFDASLIIAAVQNRVKEAIPVENDRPMSWGFAMMIGAVVQMMIFAGAWWVLR